MTRRRTAVGHLAFFLPATVRFGPLRVRALVLVRWPRTGRPMAVAATLVAADLDLAADVGLDLATEVTLDLEVGFDLVAELDQLLVTQLVDAHVRGRRR